MSEIQTQSGPWTVSARPDVDGDGRHYRVVDENGLEVAYCGTRKDDAEEIVRDHSAASFAREALAALRSAQTVLAASMFAGVHAAALAEIRAAIGKASPANEPVRACPECLLPDDGDCACCDEVLQRLRLEESIYEGMPGPVAGV